jgi:hypothetical protein
LQRALNNKEDRVRNNDITDTAACGSVAEGENLIPLAADAHQHLIACAQDFLDHALAEVTPKMLAYLERRLADLTTDLAAVRATYNIT